jgi:hypothetical protein
MEMESYDQLNNSPKNDRFEYLSSRTTSESLGESFLAKGLRGAKLYQRIAGYFCSSILDVAGEELEAMSAGEVQVVCNARLDFVDGDTHNLTPNQMEEFLWLEWERYKTEELSSETAKQRLLRLHKLLTTLPGSNAPRMEVRIVTESQIGLLHGKAGLIVRSESGGDRSKAFLGSSNESLGGWKRNYELMAMASA